MITARDIDGPAINLWHLLVHFIYVNPFCSETTVTVCRVRCSYMSRSAMSASKPNHILTALHRTSITRMFTANNLIYKILFPLHSRIASVLLAAYFFTSTLILPRRVLSVSFLWDIIYAPIASIPPEKMLTKSESSKKFPSREPGNVFVTKILTHHRLRYLSNTTWAYWPFGLPHGQEQNRQIERAVHNLHSTSLYSLEVLSVQNNKLWFLIYARYCTQRDNVQSCSVPWRLS